MSLIIYKGTFSGRRYLMSACTNLVTQRNRLERKRVHFIYNQAHFVELR